MSDLLERTPETVDDPVQRTYSQRYRKLPFLKSLQIAFGGAFHVLRTERNAKIELGIAILAVTLGLLLRINAIEWAVIVLLIGLVLALEMVNTAIEAVVNLASAEYHALAKTAKDAAAGAVLLMSISSIGVGIAIFGPRLWRWVVVLF